ncbi:hypothetical protein PMI01_02193 [Caulobacter sp. AP07]|uniref:hypothetical protein n=1 Tax=Caulobacter sp. AP07 TaxID=1144304 RepID=UPI0002722020|nr:hypothetical protein [Caulobacter sp. AP07]EJL33231.1 hypothetical protein PMI01_02193 [Caulobacter sp. AP07]
MVAETAQPIMSELRRGERRIEWGAAALLFALLVQTAGIVWWGARIDTRVSQVEQKLGASASAGETIARLDERTTSMLTTLDRIDRRLTATEERQAAREGYGR